jgi:hypothetical protein
MPMPLSPNIINVSVFLCERLMTEQDGVVSAIRLVDLFYVATPPTEAPDSPDIKIVPILQAFVCAIIKGHPGIDEEHQLEFKIINTVGELKDCGGQFPIRLTSLKGPDLPSGVTIGAGLQVAVQRFGNCFLCVYLDGEEVARTTFTVAPLPKAITLS